MNKFAAVLLSLATIGVVGADSVNALDEISDVSTTTTNVFTTTTNVTTTSTNVTTTVVTAIPTTTVPSNPCYSPGVQCGWAMLDENSNITGVIVCTVDVCGGGVWDGKRTVLQTRASGTGNVAGYNRGTYNEATNVFTTDDGRTLTGGSNIQDIAPAPTTTTLPIPETTETTVDTTPVVETTMVVVAETAITTKVVVSTKPKRKVIRQPIRTKAK